MALTKEKSEQLAVTINIIKTYLLTLDVDYLKEWITKFKEDISFKESAVILAPNPAMQMEKNDYNRTVLVFAQLLVNLAEHRTGAMKEAFPCLQHVVQMQS